MYEYDLVPALELSGKIWDICMIMDADQRKLNLGKAFVTFTTQEAARDAVVTGVKLIYGRYLKVKLCVSSMKILVNDTNPFWSKTEMMKKFSDYTGVLTLLFTIFSVPLFEIFYFNPMIQLFLLLLF